MAAASISITCPQCQKQYKAPAELAGKRIRCKQCGHAFAVESPPPSARPAEVEEEKHSYGIQEAAELTPRCPFCAEELPSAEAVICLKCGYNMKTRQRLQTKRVAHITFQDRFLWLLPGMVCVLLILTLIVLDILYVTWQPNERWAWAWLAWGGLKVWGVILSLFVIFFAARFAFRRLIREPTPPERTAD